MESESHDADAAYGSGVTTTEELLVGVLMLVGLAGVVVPVVPGLLLVLAGALWWTIGDGGSVGHWTYFTVIALVFVAGTVLKYVVPARRTAVAGTATRSMVFAAGVGIVGLFVIPIIGAPIGFVLGIYLAELQRLHSRQAAWTSTRAALNGVALSMLIEFSAGVVMIGIWLLGALTS